MSRLSRRDWIKLVGARGTIGAMPSELWGEGKEEKSSAESENFLVNRKSILEHIRHHDPIWEVAAKSWNQGLLLRNGDLGVNEYE
jgi:hypothetical protein